MLRTIAAAALCTAVFAAGAQAATNRITADGFTVSAEGAFASGGAYETPIGSSVAIDITVDEAVPVLSAGAGRYGGSSTGPGGSGIASFGGSVVLDVTGPVSWSDLVDDVAIDASLSAAFAGLIAVGTYDMVGFGVQVGVPGQPDQSLQTSLILFLPSNSFETWTSLADVPFGAVTALMSFDFFDDGPEIADVAYASVSGFSVAPVPLPAAAPLLIAGIAGLGALRRFKR